MSNVPLPQRLIRAVLRPLSSLLSLHQNRVVIVLAALVSAVAVYAILGGHTAGMKDRAYDAIMKARLLAPAADPGIVIVDINEASLAVMAKEYGRWPWPRTVIGELVEGIARQKPKAIVFDVMFSDPDVYNKDADKYFRDVVRRTPNTYFPLIRLNEENDSQSQLKLSSLPGVDRTDDAEPEATLAAVVPFVLDQLDGRRIGTTNLFTDDDGIVRRYGVWLDAHGWRIGSLPANVVRGTGGTVPDQEDVLLNWRGKPPSYTRVPLHEVYTDLQAREPKRPANEFAGKIVIIGSTAPSLFDYKPTPVAKIHPGVEVLATAIDNLQRGDYLRELPHWITVVITVFAIGLFTLAAVYNVDVRRQNLFFTLAQVSFVTVAYLLLNFSTVYLDMTAPIAFSLIYFTLVKLIGVVVTFRRNGHPLFSTLLDEGRTLPRGGHAGARACPGPQCPRGPVEPAEEGRRPVTPRRGHAAAVRRPAADVRLLPRPPAVLLAVAGGGGTRRGGRRGADAEAFPARRRQARAMARPRKGAARDRGAAQLHLHRRRGRPLAADGRGGRRPAHDHGRDARWRRGDGADRQR